MRGEISRREVSRDAGKRRKSAKGGKLKQFGLEWTDPRGIYGDAALDGAYYFRGLFDRAVRRALGLEVEEQPSAWTHSVYALGFVVTKEALDEQASSS